MMYMNVPMRLRVWCTRLVPEIHRYDPFWNSVPAPVDHYFVYRRLGRRRGSVLGKNNLDIAVVDLTRFGYFNRGCVALRDASFQRL